MVRVEIDIPYPRQTLFFLAGAMGWVLWMSAMVSPAPAGMRADALGGDPASAQEVVKDAEEEIRTSRIEQAVISRQEEILRYQLAILENERKKFGKTLNEHVEDQFRRSVNDLVALLKSKHDAEARIRESLYQLWEAEGRAVDVARGALNGAIRLVWPVAPQYGISAYFNDPAYEKLFGMAHQAIDIPVEQGTTITAAADGVVENVTDNGMGFSSVVIRHDGFATLYGHVSSFLVQEGQEVRAGDPIAKSGGMPGTAGAGHLSTGPHVHLELIVDGVHVDPLEYLPSLEESRAPSAWIRSEDDQY